MTRSTRRRASEALEVDADTSGVPSPPSTLSCPQCKATAPLGPQGHILEHQDAMGGVCIATGRRPDGE